ncbi:Pelo, partial [Symbiodinium sp. KB8]
YIFEEAARQGLAALLHNKSKFLQVHTSGGGTQALSEALAEPSVAKLLQDTKAAAQVMALKRFFELLHTDAERAMYGHRFVAYSVERGAVETLLIADDQFRAADLAQRAANIRLSEDTQAAGGKVHVFSTQHASGQQLGELGGVAAILRFPLPEAEDALLATAVAEDEDVSSDEEELYARLSLEMSANKAAGTAAPASAGAGSAAR